MTRDVEATETKGEKSSELNKLAGMKSKSKDDESLIFKPLQYLQSCPAAEKY